MEIEALASRHGVRIARWLGDSAVLLANSAQVSALAAERDVLSGDLPVAPFMDVSTVVDRGRSGSQRARRAASRPRRHPGRHRRRASPSRSSTPASPRIRRSRGKVIANVSKVAGDPSTNDAHGHGTHIAGIIAGNSTASKDVTSLYSGGIAPDVKLVNVRVLGANGTGWTSDVIDGIEWVIANRDTYKIRVDQSVARASGDRAVDDRSAVHGGHESDRCGHRRHRVGRQRRQGRGRHAHPRRHHVARQLSVRDHRRRDEHERHGRRAPTTS